MTGIPRHQGSDSFRGTELDRAIIARPGAVAAKWDTRLELRLAEHDAARVLNAATLFRLARHAHPRISRASLERWIRDALASKRLVKVVRGLYLNRMPRPPGELAEAAIWLRSGAVVSLQKVLGDSGVWNNHTPVVAAVVPFSADSPRPSLGVRVTHAGEFLFRGIPENVLNAGKENDRLADVTGYLRATPEAALLHWMYLAASPHSNLAAPPFEMDLDELSVPRMQRLAKAMDLSGELSRWLSAKKDYDASPSVSEKTWIA